ncbi:hypothetical protein [Flavilitoribacter nigricans]|uniref:hypothetical protein n=1 Tax=Flavilitoribacter nigricans TaxID=70997 RepID=UPI001472835E|nr:hypothetical protein [Flavilitoribacter nigricans]
MTIEQTKEITIAILPFRLLNERETLHPILSGFAEDLSIAFSKFIGLSVISHYSTSHIRDVSDREAIEALGAQYLVTGSFRMQGECIRIGIHLIRTSNYTLAFSDQHEEKLNKIMTTHDKIVQQVVSVLQQQVDYDLLSFSFKKKTVQLAAYEKWLIGRELLKKGTAESDQAARQYFTEALEIDPAFARAYTGLSLSYFNEWSCQLWDRWDVSQKGAQENALKALEIDDSDYLSLAVLGRTYLFSAEYDKAEHYLRKALRMNPNDADNLILIALSFMFLGYNEEAEKLYHKACFLNPMRQESYFLYGSNIYLELGDYQRAFELGQTVRTQSVWVDFWLYMAGAAYYLGDTEQMQHYWAKYKETFQKFINRGEPATDREALQWHIDVNPYKNGTRLQEFRDFVRNGWSGTAETDRPAPAVADTSAYFLQKGEFWEIGFAGESALLKDAKGFHDLARLIAEPEKEWHCTELMGAVLVDVQETAALDAKALTSYRTRIRELQAELQEAEQMNDLGRTGSLQSEYDQLLSYLSGSLNQKGQARNLGASTEKARAAVTWRIRSAIKKIDRQHTALGRHLSHAVKTGNYCSYQPERPVAWKVSM